MFRPLLLLLALLVAGSTSAQAQVITAGPDSVQVNPTAPTKKQLSAADSAARTERLFGLHVTRPTKAALLALAPGGGQIYNRRYWKLPLVYGLLGGLGYAIYFNKKRYNEYVDAFDAISNADPPLQPGALLITVLDAGENKDKFPHASKERSIANIQRGYEFYRHNLDLSILLSLGGYGLTVLDALVDAHLHDFDVSDDLTLHWNPTLLPVPGQPLPGFGATVTLRYK